MLRPFSKNAVLFTVIFFIVLLALVYFSGRNFSLAGVFNGNKISRIAVCPTYHHLENLIADNDIRFVKTSRTAESVELLANNEVDYVIAGRTLKPHEGSYNSEFLTAKGYSFLAKDSIILSDSQLSNFDIYTDDIDLPNIIAEHELGSLEISYVDDVYEYINNDLVIVITSWENTDYSKADVVHVYTSLGERLEISRRAIIYCSSDCKDKIINKLKEIL